MIADCTLAPVPLGSGGAEVAVEGAPGDADAGLDSAGTAVCCAADATGVAVFSNDLSAKSFASFSKDSGASLPVSYTHLTLPTKRIV